MTSLSEDNLKVPDARRGSDEDERPWLPRIHFYEINDQSW
jgi:hypothetical protein